MTHAFFEGRHSPVVKRPAPEHWWHSTPLPDGTRTESVQEWSQDTQFMMWDAFLPQVRDALVGGQVLDVGAADGFFAAAAAAAGAAAVHAIDIDYPFWPRNLRYLASSWNLDITAHTGDFRQFDFGQRFDLIIFLGMIYHVEDVFGAIRRLRQLLLPGGRIVIETHISQLTGLGVPVFEAASDIYPTAARQGVEGIDEVGGCNYLFPNALAIYQLAHMFKFSCAGPLACEYTSTNPHRQLFVFEHLPDTAPRWTPPRA